MTDLRKAAEMALVALDSTARSAVEQYVIEQQVVTFLKQALAQNPLDIADRAYFAGKKDGIDEALAQPEQPPILTEKDGSPCPEFWDWLPKAYSFDGLGEFTKYNMEAAFLAGKNTALAQPEQAHTDHPMRHWDRTCPACVAEPSNSISNFGESKALAQPEQDPWDTSDMAHRTGGLNVEECIDRGAWSDVPDATKWVDELRGDEDSEQEPVAWDGDCVLGHCGSPDGCDRFGRCRAAPPSKPWVSLTDEEIDGFRSGYQSGRIGTFVELTLSIEAALRSKNT